MNPPDAAAAADEPDPAPAADMHMLANALNNIATLLQINQGGGGVDGGGAAGNGGAAAGAAAAVATAPLLNLFLSSEPFDLRTRAGSTAHSEASAALDVTWSGDVAGYPEVVHAFAARARKCNWDARTAQGIIFFDTGIAPTVVQRNIITEHFSITAAEVEAARAARTDPRAIQNAQCMYDCLVKTAVGDLKTMLLSKLPDYPDGPNYWKDLTSHTLAATRAASTLALEQINNFAPSSCQFNVPTMNSKLQNLFLLATMHTRTMTEDERINHTINAYDRIKQPESWAQWVRNQHDRIDDQAITDCRTFMNSAAIKFIRIQADNKGVFNGSSTTFQDDVVAMIASARQAKRKAPPLDAATNASTNKRAPSSSDSPPFVTDSKDASGTAYKLGDNKVWKGTTYHYCPAPNHRYGSHWHTHTGADCRTHSRWVARGSPAGPPVAHLGDAAADDAATALTDAGTRASNANNGGTESGSVAPPVGDDITILLANALSIAPSDHSKGLIADALSSLQDF